MFLVSLRKKYLKKQGIKGIDGKWFITYKKGKTSFAVHLATASKNASSDL